MGVVILNSKVFSSCINLLQANYEKMPSNKELLNVWYKALQHYTDEQFMEATKKIMLNEAFAPKLDTLAKYCSEIAAPIEVDDTEAWGKVVKAINHYGYMRAEEAIKTLPETVKQAVERVGGFEMICSSEEPDVIRGQFNKAMAAINQAERVRRREKTGLEQVLALANWQEEPLAIEFAEWKRSSEDTVDKGLSKVYEAYRKARGMDEEAK